MLNGAAASLATSLTSVSLCQYEAAVEENKADIQILTMTVTDGDEPHSPAWNAKFKIVGGDPGGHFTVKTGTNKQEGIISTAKVRMPPALHPGEIFVSGNYDYFLLTIALLLRPHEPGSGL